MAFHSRRLAHKTDSQLLDAKSVESKCFRLANQGCHTTLGRSHIAKKSGTVTKRRCFSDTTYYAPCPARQTASGPVCQHAPEPALACAFFTHATHTAHTTNAAIHASARCAQHAPSIAAEEFSKPVSGATWRHANAHRGTGANECKNMGTLWRERALCSARM